jgi:hypothetical protein
MKEQKREAEDHAEYKEERELKIIFMQRSVFNEIEKKLPRTPGKSNSGIIVRRTAGVSVFEVFFDFYSLRYIHLSLQKVEMSSPTFDAEFQSLEDTIEVARLDQDWETVKSSLHQYSKIFDFNYDVSTRYHVNIKEMKCYYWICSAEYTFHLTGDFNGCIDGLRHAGAFHYASPEIRIMIIRFFLAACRPSILKLKAVTSQLHHVKSLSNFDLENLDLQLYLGDYAKVNPIFVCMNSVFLESFS